MITKNNQHTLKQRSALALGIMSLCVFGLAAQAQNIVWGPATGISGDSDVSTNGTLVQAYHFEENVNYQPQTVNGVTFADFLVSGPAGTTSPVTVGNTTLTSNSGVTINGASGSFAGSSAPYTNLDGSYQILLSKAVYSSYSAGFTITLNGLTVGDQYQLQLWANDSSSGGIGQNRTTTLTGGANSVTLTLNTSAGEVNGGLGQYVIGTFTATSASQVIDCTTATGYLMNVCAFQLRNLTGGGGGGTNQNYGVFTGYTNGNVCMIFYGTPGWQYVIQRATNLVQSGIIWVSIATNIFPGSGSIAFTDTFSNITPPPPPYPRAAYYRFQSQTNGPLANFWNGVEGAWYADAGNLGEQGEDGFGLGGFIFPSMLVNAATSEIWAYYIFHYNGTNFLTGDAEIKSTVGRARSADTDGVSWVCDGMVMDVGAAGQWDDQYASFPGIWKDSNTWYLVYEGAGDGDSANSSPGDIGLATSTDGLNFVKYPGNPILRHNATGWENNNIGTPSLYKANGTWYLFYHGFDGTYCRDGVATGTSLTNLVKYAGNPIIDVASNTNAWDSGTIGRRSAIAQEGGYYYLAYEGSTPQPYSTAQWSSGLARSTDLFHWTKFSGNPVLPRTTSGFGYDGPEMIQIKGTWYIYVRINGSEEPEMRFRLQ